MSAVGKGRIVLLSVAGFWADSGCAVASEPGRTSASIDGASANDGGGVTDGGSAKGSETCPGAVAERNGVTALDLDRIAFVGSTDFVVRFCNPLMPEEPGSLIFYVQADDHLGIPPSGFTQATWVVNSVGARTQGAWTWTGTDLTVREHHAAGLLTGPRSDADGGDLIGPDTAWIDLHLGGIGESEASLTLRWDRGFLP